LLNIGCDGRATMNWKIYEKTSKGWIIVLRSSSSIEKGFPVSHETKETSGVQTYVKYEFHEIHGTFYPPYLSPFSSRFFGKTLGF